MSTSSQSSARSFLARKCQVDLIDSLIARMDSTGATFILAISGNGFFVVRDPKSDKTFVTQARHFYIDENGHLLTPAGARLQGRIGPGLKEVGDLRVSAAGLPQGTVPNSVMLCYSIDDWGKITVHMADGASFLCGQIVLQNFSEPQALVNEGNQLYSNFDAAGPLPALATPGSNGLGTIQAGVLELSSAGPLHWQN
jgi:flagellar hook protein FlgE